MNDTRIPVPPENPDAEEILATCQRCGGKCCSYVALEIDEPTTRADFENIRWYCAHKDVWVFKEDGDWYVVFDSPCVELAEDFSCRIHDERPQVCRDHPFGECDYFLRGRFDLELRTREEVEAYIRRRFPRSFRKGKGKASAAGTARG